MVKVSEHGEIFDVEENIGVLELKTFDCDDLMAPIVVELNKKGYITTDCCSGHYATHSINDINAVVEYPRVSCLPYIRFAPGINKFAFGLPDGWHFEVHEPIRKRSDGVIMYDSIEEGSTFDIEKCVVSIYHSLNAKYLSPYDFYRHNLADIESLYEWAKTLPKHHLSIPVILEDLQDKYNDMYEDGLDLDKIITAFKNDFSSVGRKKYLEEGSYDNAKIAFIRQCISKTDNYDPIGYHELKDDERGYVVFMFDGNEIVLEYYTLSDKILGTEFDADGRLATALSKILQFHFAYAEKLKPFIKGLAEF